MKCGISDNWPAIGAAKVREISDIVMRIVQGGR